MGRYEGTVIHIVGAALVLCVQYEVSLANVIGLGACPSYTPTFTAVTNPFVPAAGTTAATRTWYLHRRLPSYHSGLTCVKFVITGQTVSGLFTNTVTITGKKPITRTAVTVTGTIGQRTAGNVFNYDASFTSAGNTISHLPTSLVVIATNGNYLVLYGCIPYGLFNKQFSWVLTTTQSSTSINIAAGLTAANILGFPINKYQTVEQNFC